jgi:hypothetical protein
MTNMAYDDSAQNPYELIFRDYRRLIQEDVIDGGMGSPGPDALRMTR